MIPPRKYPVEPQQERDDHYCWCEICQSWVDELDLEEVAQHLEPDHRPPTKN